MEKLKVDQEKLARGGRSLGPNDSDETRAARLKRQRAREYADANNKINLAVMPLLQQQQQNQRVAGAARASGDGESVAPSSAGGGGQPTAIKPRTPPELVEARLKRERVKEFARNIPKPKVAPLPAAAVGPGAAAGDAAHHGGRSSAFEASDPESGAMTAEGLRRLRLMELEAQHARDREAVERLRKQLKMQ
jgi:hypothetical protein